MPNHITNWVAFRGPKEALDAIEKALVEERLFETFCPPPTEMLDPDILKTTLSWSTGEDGRHADEERRKLAEKYGFVNALAWQTHHWSTKWDVYFVKPPVRVDDGLLLSRFDTAWGMPARGLEAVAEKTNVSLFCVAEDEGGWPVNAMSVTLNGDTLVAQTFRTAENDPRQSLVTLEVAHAAGTALGWLDVIPRLGEAFEFSTFNEEDYDETETP